MDLKIIGKRLRAARKAKCFTIDDAAKLSGYSARTVRRCEAGETASMQTFLDLCNTYSVMPSRLLMSDSDVLDLLEECLPGELKGALGRLNSTLDRSF